MKFGLNRSQLKNIALVFMVLDNAWLRFSTSFTSVAHLITRFVAPLFAWLMVDGFFHTKSRGRYCRRLWIAAILMQIGNVISFGLFGQKGITDNIFLTLAFGFTIIWLFELAKNAEQRREIKNSRERYIHSILLEKAEYVVVTGKIGDRGRYRERNRFMVDNSSRLIAVYREKQSGSGTLQTINMAKRAGLAVHVIELDKNPQFYIR